MSQGTNNSARNKRSRWLYRVLFGVLGLLGIGVVTYIATCLFGFVSGEEFSPDTFARRSFYYYQIPLIHLQVSPIGRDDQTNALETHLCAKKYVPVDKKKKPRWDLVLARRAGVVITQGDAAILCAYLDSEDKDGNLCWKKWTEDHPKVAKILWPEVARVARRQLYMFTPEMLELATGAANVDAFALELNRLLARKYSDLADVQQQLELHETAVELLNEAIRYAPDDSELKERRSKSQQAVDRDEEPGSDS